jgi:hypothetical protein
MLRTARQCASLSAVYSALWLMQKSTPRSKLRFCPPLAAASMTIMGWVASPSGKSAGSNYKGEEEISPRFRRWWGYGLFFGGMVLLVVDWRADFGLLWPAMFATRMMPIGLLLLVTELVICIEARRKKRREERSPLEPKPSGAKTMMSAPGRLGSGL